MCLYILLKKTKKYNIKEDKVYSNWTKEKNKIITVENNDQYH